MTPAQRRALDWLPRDRSWVPAPHSVANALLALVRDHPEHAETKLDERAEHRLYRITRRGLAVRRRLQERETPAALEGNGGLPDQLDDVGVNRTSS